ncbi:hypothetical protein [Pseudoalteromonas sp. MMG012]|uniref:hypothetical protein n=1 Tax=Pseudoalteromonas sp. MMG012 TaxID=2822686 RepID=UPI001B3A5794|nr:hypothetical protein [Pseudoalteromonas sp. MMG012]MBQ4852693.1 hypothetical protein [Pseudoalteromonas sp. MMG012]
MTESIENIERNALRLKELETSETQKGEVRKKLLSLGFDPTSLLGTTADAAQILIYEVAKLCSALNTAQSLEDVRNAAKPINDLLGSTINDVDTGIVKFPYQHKGQDVVVAEIKQRSTAVADILIAAQEQ